MLLKYKKFLINLLFITAFLVSQIGLVQGTRSTCELIEVDKSKPLYKTSFNSSAIESSISRLQEDNGLTLEQAKGKIGELAARITIEDGAINLSGNRLVSISQLFQTKGCNVNEQLRDNADRGIDDIFVVRGRDGWIDRNYAPVFHESKYDGRCSLKLSHTRTLCQQLSFEWLNGNLEKAHYRTQTAKLCLGEQNEFVINSCLSCKDRFQSDVQWLIGMLQSRHFHRTASLLCADGTLKIYQVNGKR